MVTNNKFVTLIKFEYSRKYSVHFVQLQTIRWKFWKVSLEPSHQDHASKEYNPSKSSENHAKHNDLTLVSKRSPLQGCYIQSALSMLYRIPFTLTAEIFIFKLNSGCFCLFPTSCMTSSYVIPIH